MAHQQFNILDENPNDISGGGGCLCDRRKLGDCKPPYADFYGNRMLDTASPRPVICESCALRVVERMQQWHEERGDAEALQGVERDRVTGQPIPQPVRAAKRSRRSVEDDDGVKV